MKTKHKTINNKWTAYPCSVQLIDWFNNQAMWTVMEVGEKLPLLKFPPLIINTKHKFALLDEADFISEVFLFDFERSQICFFYSARPLSS